MWRTPDDLCPTATSIEQRHTEEAISELFAPYVGEDALPLPPLQRDDHVAYLHKLLAPLPAPYVTFDANRAWLVYWIAHSLDLLGAPLEGTLRARAISTLLHFQHSAGGFGGGPGQIGHLMSTYAAVSALAIVGGPGPMPDEADVAEGRSIDVGCGGWDAIDRCVLALDVTHISTRLYAWLLRLKQPDGSFLVHEQGEIDVRATYCAVAVASMLGLATPELLRDTGAFVASCQTYEGGFAALSSPSYSLCGADVRPAAPIETQAPQGEAHGGYSYCALAAHAQLALLGPYAGPVRAAPLLRWATSLQGTAVEGGGMRGRTNKLVDGCYGWFCGGGLMTLLEGVLVPPSAPSNASDSWTSLSDASDDLFDRAALRAYILVAAQVPRGGLRDKPGKRPDAYHTCYNLSGLALCEHRLRPNAAAADMHRAAYDAHVPAGRRSDLLRECYAQTLAWDGAVDGAAVAATHPILNVGLDHVRRMLAFTYGLDAAP